MKKEKTAFIANHLFLGLPLEICLERIFDGEITTLVGLYNTLESENAALREENDYLKRGHEIRLSVIGEVKEDRDRLQFQVNLLREALKDVIGEIDFGLPMETTGDVYKRLKAALTKTEPKPEMDGITVHYTGDQAEGKIKSSINSAHSFTEGSDL